MVVSMVEGKVAQEKQEALSRAYQDLLADGLPPAILQTYLLRRTDDKSSWRIVTIWKSAEALQEVRSASEPAPAVRLFNAAGVDPKVDIFEVIHTVATQHETHGAHA